MIKLDTGLEPNEVYTENSSVHKVVLITLSPIFPQLFLWHYNKYFIQGYCTLHLIQGTLEAQDIILSHSNLHLTTIQGLTNPSKPLYRCCVSQIPIQEKRLPVGSSSLFSLCHHVQYMHSLNPPHHDDGCSPWVNTPYYSLHPLHLTGYYYQDH